MQEPPRLIVLDRFPDDARDGWSRLIRDVIGGGSAPTAFIAALDASVDPLLDGIDVEAALSAADGPGGDAARPHVRLPEAATHRSSQRATPAPRRDLVRSTSPG